MQPRRTPGGQRPARRPGQPGRTVARRTTAREGSLRADGRTTPTRTPPAGRFDGARSASRPAAARRAGAGGTAKRTTAPQPRRITGRATVLFAVLIALALAYTYPVRVLLRQQADIARMEAAQAAQRRKISELTAQAAKWQDKEYVRIQARERLYMTYPGQVPLLVVVDPAGAARDAGQPTTPPHEEKPSPWYDTLWSSIEAANADRGNG